MIILHPKIHTGTTKLGLMHLAAVTGWWIDSQQKLQDHSVASVDDGLLLDAAM